MRHNIHPDTEKQGKKQWSLWIMITLFFIKLLKYLLFLLLQMSKMQSSDIL